MSKFPNQLAIVSVIGVSAIAVSVGLSERAAHKAELAAHEAAMHAETAAASAIPHGDNAEDSVVAQEAAETAGAVTTEVAEAVADTGSADETVVAEESTPVMSPAADTLDDKPAMASTMINGHGSTAEITGSMEGGKFGLGREALPEEIHAWTKQIFPDGRGLPDGEGSVEDGEMIFADNCAVCHGDFAEGVDNWPKLAGGMDTLDHEDPLKTVGSYWPYLSTTYDYVRRSMPFGAAQTMGDEDVYAIVAYILYSNDLVDDDFVLSKDNFLEVEMPNADGFIVDDRAETEYGVFTEACMENCKDSVEITMRAAVLDVTPDHGGGEAAAVADEGMEAAGEMGTPDEPTEAAAEAVDVAEVADAPNDEVAETEAAAEPAAAEAAAPDPELVAAGEKVFRKCKACHEVGDGAKNKVGPVLNGVVGRHAATAPDFKYSGAMVEAGEGGLVWTSETLHEYLANPKAYIKGNKMAFAGLKKAGDVDAVVAYLQAHP